jgi:hypothetical protein
MCIYIHKYIYAYTYIGLYVICIMQAKEEVFSAITYILIDEKENRLKLAVGYLKYCVSCCMINGGYMQNNHAS